MGNYRQYINVKLLLSLTLRPGCTNDDQISVKLNQVYVRSAIWNKFNSNFVVPTWTRFNWWWFSWTEILNHNYNVDDGDWLGEI